MKDRWSWNKQRQAARQHAGSRKLDRWSWNNQRQGGSTHAGSKKQEAGQEQLNKQAARNSAVKTEEKGNKQSRRGSNSVKTKNCEKRREIGLKLGDWEFGIGMYKK